MKSETEEEGGNRKKKSNKVGTTQWNSYTVGLMDKRGYFGEGRGFILLCWG